VDRKKGITWQCAVFWMAFAATSPWVVMGCVMASLVVVMSMSVNAQSGYCVATYGSDMLACGQDPMCHIDQVGPVAECAEGPPVSKNSLFYEQPVDVVSVAALSNEPHTFEIVVRVPIFQAYETSGYFQFLVGRFYNGGDLTSYTPNAVCNSLQSNIIGNAWPQTYAELRDVPSCGWFVGGGTTADANANLEAERVILKDWIHRNGVFPWQSPTDGGAAYDPTKAECWRSIIGDIKVNADVGGFIHHVDIPDDPNILQYTMRMNADAIYGACSAVYPDMYYLANDVGTDRESIQYIIPLTFVQRTSHQQQIVSGMQTILNVVTTGNVTVSTTIYQPVTINQLGLTIDTVDMVPQESLDPDESMASASLMAMVFRLTIEQPADVVSLGPRDTANDIVLNIPGQPVNCYGDYFITPEKFEAITPCSVDGNGKTQCSFLIRINSPTRTDLYDGSSFATCAGTVGAARNPLDKLHIFGIKIQLCTLEGCSYVSSEPIRVVSSFFVPVFPVRTVTQNEQIFGLLLPTAETAIVPLSAELGNHVIRRVITTTDTINVAIVTRPALWSRYMIRIRPDDDGIQLFRANLNVPVADTTDGAWTFVADQSTLVDVMRVRPQLKNIAESEDPNEGRYPACIAVGLGCDGFSFDAQAIMDLTDGPQIKFVVKATIDMQTYNPVSRRLLSAIDVPKSLGRWSTTIKRAQAQVHVGSAATEVDQSKTLPLRSERRRRTQLPVPATQTSLTNEPFTGRVGSAFVFSGLKATVLPNTNGTSSLNGTQSTSGDDDGENLGALLGGLLGGILGAICVIGCCVTVCGGKKCCRSRNRDAQFTGSPAIDKAERLEQYSFSNIMSE